MLFWIRCDAAVKMDIKTIEFNLDLSDIKYVK